MFYFSNFSYCKLNQNSFSQNELFFAFEKRSFVLKHMPGFSVSDLTGHPPFHVFLKKNFV